MRIRRRAPPTRSQRASGRARVRPPRFPRPSRVGRLVAVGTRRRDSRTTSRRGRHRPRSPGGRRTRRRERRPRSAAGAGRRSRPSQPVERPPTVIGWTAMETIAASGPAVCTIDAHHGDRIVDRTLLGGICSSRGPEAGVAPAPIATGSSLRQATVHDPGEQVDERTRRSARTREQVRRTADRGALVHPRGAVVVARVDGDRRGGDARQLATRGHARGLRDRH